MTASPLRTRQRTPRADSQRRSARRQTDLFRGDTGQRELQHSPSPVSWTSTGGSHNGRVHARACVAKELPLQLLRVVQDLAGLNPHPAVLSLAAHLYQGAKTAPRPTMRPERGKSRCAPEGACAKVTTMLYALTPAELACLAPQPRDRLAQRGFQPAARAARGYSSPGAGFPGTLALDALVHLPLVLPPVAVGYLLLVMPGQRASPPAAGCSAHFGVELPSRTARRYAGAPPS